MAITTHMLCHPHYSFDYSAGVLELKQGNVNGTTGAVALLETAVELLSGLPAHTRRVHEATYFCLGHAYRKAGRYADALGAYGQSLALCPGKPSTLAAMAFTHALVGSPVKCAELCHAVLAQAADDTFTNKVSGASRCGSCCNTAS